MNPSASALIEQILNPSGLPAQPPAPATSATPVEPSHVVIARILNPPAPGDVPVPVPVVLPG